MRALCYFIVATIIGVQSAWLHADTVANNTSFPEVLSPGESVTIVGPFDPTRQSNALIKLYLVGTDSIQNTLAGRVTDKAITVKLPDNLKPGRYYLSVDYGELTDKLVASELRVQASAVLLDAAHPTTAYHNGKGGFDFDVVGENFSETPEDNQIYVSGRGPIIRSWFREREKCNTSVQLPCLWIESKEQLHVVGYQSERYQGPLLLSVSVGSVRTAEKPLVLARMSETGVLVCSTTIFLALGFLIYRIVARGMRGNIIDGEHYSPFWSFFIDKETNSYSLSKFQLLLFFSVFVFAYLYVFLCRWLVQWQFVLPDVPANFTGVLAISAGTVIVAAGATATRGSKGAGSTKPSAADFISIGGQVVPERFQFFVWALVACLGFLALLISQNPATIKEFPQFPQGLLYVMGVSAGGYLGGKLTRAAGPVIRNIAWDKDAQEITVQGENLSSDADFYVDSQKLPIDPKAKQQLVTSTPQEQASDRSFSSLLKIRVNPIAEVDLSTGDHMFRITNKDGQFADVRFTVDPPVIAMVTMAAGSSPPVAGAPDPNKLIVAGKEAAVIVVKGAGFRIGTTARWTPANAPGPIDLPPSAVQFADSNTLKITLVGGEKGTGVLMLVTPNGFSVTTTVTVA